MVMVDHNLRIEVPHEDKYKPGNPFSIDGGLYGVRNDDKDNGREER